MTELGLVDNSWREASRCLSKSLLFETRKSFLTIPNAGGHLNRRISSAFHLVLMEAEEIM
jgi:hypothetical protein